MIRLVCLIVLLPLPAVAEFRPPDAQATSICVDVSLDHAGKVAALVAAGWSDLPPDARTPAAQALGAAFAIRTLRRTPEMGMAAALEASQQDWGNRIGETGTEQTAWLQADAGEAFSFLMLRTDGAYVGCSLAIPPGLGRQEFIDAAGLTEKIKDEGDIPGGHMMVFDNAPSHNGVLSIILPEPEYFVTEGLPVPPALLLTSTQPAP
jgi:hypothetical protein